MSDLMETLLLEKEVVVTSDLTESVSSEPTMNVAQTLKFKRMLISRVRKHPQLYDKTHDEFSHDDIKYIIWNKIAEKLKTEVEICQQTWVDLRFDYQRFVRRLRAFLRYGNKNRRRRPVFAFETEMLFLWRFITNISLAPPPFAKAAKNRTKPIQAEEEDDDIVILDEEPVVIDLDDEGKNSYASHAPKFKVTNEMRRLIEMVKGYPELYDSEHRYFHDYRRKGIIWNAIANEGRDKATRLMKLWIQLQTRYEWELWYNINAIPEDNTSSTDLRCVLSFMRDAIKKNPNTVYKQSLFLKMNWHEPIDHFKNIFNLISLLKKNLNVINETEKQISLQKDGNYVVVWNKLAQSRASNQPAGQLEATWLTLRYFYWELMSMRKTSYQLQDKWYFESIITEMYAQARAVAGINTTTATLLPMASLPPAITQGTATSSTTPPIAATVSTLTTALGIINTMQPISQTSPPPLTSVTTPTLPTLSQKTIFNTSTTSKSTTTTTNQQSQIVMPKIVSAKSLAVPMSNAKQNLNAPKGLQIYQVMPQNAMTVIPQQHQQLQQPQPQMGAYNNLSMSSTQNQHNQQQQHNMMALPKIASVHTIATMATAAATNTLTSSTSLATSSMTTTSIHPPLSNMLNAAHIPAKIVPIRGTSSKLASQPIPVKLVAASSAAATAALNQQSVQPPLPFPVPMPALTAIQQPNPLNYPTISGIGGLQIQPIQNENRTTNSATSTLNPNEIMIELNSTADGNRLVVHGPPLTTNYSLNMTEITAFIREIMALPLLHNKYHTQTARAHSYWVYLANKFKMPAHICRAIWNFLSENFNHFPKIAPLEVLMAPPFVSKAVAWQEGTDFLSKFYDIVEKKGWLVHEDKLPILMQKIGEVRCLYQDLLRNNDAVIPVNTFEIQGAWMNLRNIFGINDVDMIWAAFKSAFWQYMQEIEWGFENHWPQRLWRTFFNMNFLINQRYNMNEPLFYIVRNKFNEEVERCKSIEENLAKHTKRIEKIIETNVKPYEIDAYNLLAAMRRHSDVYLAKQIEVKRQAWLKIAEELNTSVVACRLTFQRALKNYRYFMARDPVSRCRLNQRYYKHMHAIYRAVTTSQKINIKTVNELNQSVGVSDANECNEIVFPDRMIMDITMDNSDVALVMKNWMYGIGNCKKPSVQNSLPDKLQALFKSYEKFASKE